MDGIKKRMRNFKKTSVSLNIDTVEEVDNRSKGKVGEHFSAPNGMSPVIDRDLGRYYKLVTATKPNVNPAWEDYMVGVWTPLSEMKPTPIDPTLVRSMLTASITAGGHAEAAEMNKTVMAFSPAEVLALVDVLDMRIASEFRKKEKEGKTTSD